MVISNTDDIGILDDEDNIEFEDPADNTHTSGTLTDTGYPLYKKMANINKNTFNELIKEFSFVIQKSYNGEYDKNKIYILEDWWKNLVLNSVTDIFTEDCRIRCRHKPNEMSLLEHWNANKEKLLKSTNDIMKLRELLYYTSLQCNNFNISIALTIFRLFKSKRILDITAGWGDKLVAAIGHDADYYFSSDPNLCMYDKYNHIIDTLANGGDKKNFIVENRSFEFVMLPLNKRFDMCLGMIPFYGKFIYSNSPEDPEFKYKTSDDWYKKFLLYSVKKSINVLAVGGYIIIYYIKSAIYDRLVSNINKYLRFRGIVSYYYPETKSVPRQMYVWKKDFDENPNFIVQRYEDIDIIRDDLLEAGTKQRALIGIIRKLSTQYDSFAIFVNDYGMDGLTLSYACSLFNKVAHIFVANSHKMRPGIKAKIVKYGGIIYDNTSSVEAKKIKGNRGDNMYEFLPGFESDMFSRTLEKKLRFSLGTTFVYQWINKYDEIWLADRVGNFSKVLFNIFKNSNIFTVKLDKQLHNDIDDPRYTVIEYQKPELKNNSVPFNSCPDFDAKAWNTLISSNKSKKNILFWNTAGG